ncbi:hypothetical protein AX769_10135 [Frondihabitans sp. PAMC 28766]|uniref:hypothetical protein n=1 Tax=Frondihabitans sp. PAMC 28766 TaxID=1795630 RepID=UPI00078D60D5|nr:hypothetical protein [Frondihabitans sp. PAMC 28766]AMM20441.1 hypothetical protein AX769_10135 [Frondihabitans sp. PAMC 28766]
MTKKNSAWRAAVAVPAVVLIGLGGSALVAAPALADTATATTSSAPTATAGATSTPAVTPTSPAASTAAPTATSPATTSPATTAPATPAPATTASATPVATPTAAPEPVTHAAAKAPTTLTVTFPTPEDPDSDTITPNQLDSRDFDVTGTAPIGSDLEIDDQDGDPLATLTTTATTFSIPISLPADGPYEDELDVYGSHGNTDFDDVYVDVEFAAPTSVAPTLVAPSVTTYSVAPLPLGLGTTGNVVKFSGTGTPGEDVELFNVKTGVLPATTGDTDDPFGDTDAEDYDYETGATFHVGATGAWSGYAVFPYGTESIWAGEQQLDDNENDASYGEAVTHLSPLAGPVDITLTKPAGTVDVPEITEPSYFDDVDGSGDGGTFVGGFADGSSSASTASSGASTTRPALKTSASVASSAQKTASSDAASRFADLPTAEQPFANLPHSLPAAKSAPAGRAATSDSTARDSVSGDPGDETIDQIIAEDGIQVKGKPSTTQHGYLTTTVSGTGTPGDHIVLDARDGDAEVPYITALYPQLATELDAYDTVLENSDDPNGVIPPSLTTTTTTSLLPKDTGAVTVAADGTWSATVTLKPGSYGILAFAVDPTTAKYSASSALLAVHLTGTPIVDPAATTTPATLAFTGSRGTGVTALAGFAALVAGGALLAIARRRRRGLGSDEV